MSDEDELQELIGQHVERMDHNPCDDILIPDAECAYGRNHAMGDATHGGAIRDIVAGFKVFDE